MTYACARLRGRTRMRARADPRSDPAAPAVARATPASRAAASVDMRHRVRPTRDKGRNDEGDADHRREEGRGEDWQDGDLDAARHAIHAVDESEVLQQTQRL